MNELAESMSLDEALDVASDRQNLWFEDRSESEKALVALAAELRRLQTEVTDLGGRYVSSAQAIGRVQAMCADEGTVRMADVRRALQGRDLDGGAR
jgi:hypothetical protein